MSSMRTILTSTALVGALGIGYAMWSVISPSEGRKKELLKHLPEANRVNMDETRRRNAQLMQVLKEASENPDNIARGFPPPKN